MTEKNNHIEDKTVRAYGEQALREEAQAILDQIPLLDENFEKAVDMINRNTSFLYQPTRCISWRFGCHDR